MKYLLQARDTFTPHFISSHYIEPIQMYYTNYLLYAAKRVTPVRNFHRLKQNTTIFEQDLHSVNYSAIEFASGFSGPDWPGFEPDAPQEI
jgi:hypothetical protein